MQDKKKEERELSEAETANMMNTVYIIIFVFYSAYFYI